MPTKKVDLNNNRNTSVSLSTDLFLMLKEDILAGRMKNGQKLTEQAICEKYKVSRTPVREALVQLEMEGLVEMIPNRGAFVLGLSDQDIEDMYTLRSIYEIQAVRWAITRITEKELDELEETFEFMEFYTMKKDAGKMLGINQNFHRIIYRSTHNRMLRNLLSTYQEYLKFRRGTIVKNEEHLEIVLSEHKAIFTAFKERNVEAGVIAMETHMNNTMKRYLG